MEYRNENKAYLTIIDHNRNFTFINLRIKDAWSFYEHYAFCNRNAYVLFGTYLKYSEIEIINWHRVAIFLCNQADIMFNTIVVIFSNFLQ